MSKRTMRCQHSNPLCDDCKKELYAVYPPVRRKAELTIVNAPGDLPAKRDGELRARLAALRFKTMASVGIVNDDGKRVDMYGLNDSGIDQLERLIESECAARERANIAEGIEWALGVLHSEEGRIRQIANTVFYPAQYLAELGSVEPRKFNKAAFIKAAQELQKVVAENDKQMTSFLEDADEC